MRKGILLAVACVMILAPAAVGNPIPWPLPASMPLEEMWIDIGRADHGLHAAFLGDFTFDYIPEDVTKMLFPVPVDATNVQAARKDAGPLPWVWSAELYPTILPEMPWLPMIEWPGPFPPDGAVLTVGYEHDLIERPGEFVFFYALGTGKYFPTYQKITTAELDILLPEAVGVGGVWLDDTLVEPGAYEVVDSHLLLTLTSQFGPFTRDLIISLVPQVPAGDANWDGWVDGADYTIWAEHYAHPGGCCQGDFNADGFIDGGDYTVWADNYGSGCGGASIPEPAALALLALGGLALIRRGRGV